MPSTIAAVICLVAVGACSPTSSSRRPDLEPLELPSVAQVLQELAGLPFDAFVDRSFEHWMRRSPESLSALGLAGDLGADHQHLDDLSTPFAVETASIIAGVLDQLGTYDGASMDIDQQVVAATYGWWLEDQLRLAAQRDFLYVVRPGLGSVHDGLLRLVGDLHPLSSAENADDLVRRLWRVEDKLDQAIERLDESEAARALPPRDLLIAAAAELEALAAPRSGRDSHVYALFEARLEDAGLGTRDRLERGAAAIDGAVLPGFRRLASAVVDAIPQADPSIGIGGRPGGVAAYADLLQHHTTTELDAQEVHQLGVQALDHLEDQLRERFEALGYDPEAPLHDTFARLASDSGIVAAADVAAAYEELFASGYARLDGLFEQVPAADVGVVLVDRGGYYVGPSLDGRRPGAFYASAGDQSAFGMATLAYHEAVPGHHFQIAWAQELDQPLFQRVVRFTGFVEGWALYAETLAAEQGWYADDPLGELGYLQFQAFRAARLVVDTGIHARGMTFAEARDVLVESAGLTGAAAEGQVWRYMGRPGQATAYWVGQAEILRLRAEAQAVRGPAFSLPRFHTEVLDRGALPLGILAARVQ